MTKEKLTPQEKKRLSYKKDHRTRTGEDDRAWRKAWAQRKKRVNRTYRRKATKELRSILVPGVLDGISADDGQITREFIRKGLTRVKNTRKWGVRSLQELVNRQRERRSEPRETDRERKERFAAQYMAWIIEFERDAQSPGAKALLSQMRYGEGRLWEFCSHYPEWKERFSRRLLQLQKEQQKLEQKARLKAEQKQKWLKSKKAKTI